MKSTQIIDLKSLKASIFILFLIFLPSLVSDPSPTAEDIRLLEELKVGEPVIKEEEKFLELQTSVIRGEEPCLDCIYGYNLFQETPTTFALSSNIPIPQDYVIGPGDKLKIEYFGNNKDKYEGYVTRSGSINLPLLGPFNISGLQFSKAEELIKSKINNELIGTEVFLSLSELKSISVYVVGAAYKPGTYTISSLSSLTNIIFSTGGPNKVGSLRNIEVKRQGELITSYDFYGLLLNGDTSKDIRLQEGDTIYYPLINSSVRIDGSVQRPGRFEILESDKLEDLIKFSGLIGRTDPRIEFSRYDSEKGSRIVSLTNNIKDIAKKELIDGDSINVFSSSKEQISNVYLSGEFVYPGYYDISSGERVSDVIAKAGGFTKSAYPEAAVFTRESVRQQQKDSYIKTAESLEKSLVDAISSGNQIDGEAYLAITQFIERLKEQEPIGRQVATVDEYSLLSDPSLDFTFQDGDTLYVPKRSSSVSVVGEVLNSTTHLFKDNLTVEDYIDLSGGTTDGADLSKIFVILPSGQAMVYRKKLFQQDIDNYLVPGSTVVVSRNPDPYNWFKLASIITPVLSDLAVSAAAIATISDNN